MGFAGVPEIPFTMGTSLGLGTTAQTQPQPQIPIEEILVSASKEKCLKQSLSLMFPLN